MGDTVPDTDVGEGEGYRVAASGCVRGELGSDGVWERLESGEHGEAGVAVAADSGVEVSPMVVDSTESRRREIRDVVKRQGVGGWRRREGDERTKPLGLSLYLSLLTSESLPFQAQG